MKSSKVEAIIELIWLITLTASVFLAFAGLAQIAIVSNIISWVALAGIIGIHIHNMED